MLYFSDAIWNLIFSVRSEVFMAVTVTVKSTIIRNVTPCSLAEVYRVWLHGLTSNMIVFPFSISFCLLIRRVFLFANLKFQILYTVTLIKKGTISQVKNKYIMSRICLKVYQTLGRQLYGRHLLCVQWDLQFGNTGSQCVLKPDCNNFPMTI